MDQRLQFLSSYQKEEMSVSDLCREFGVSRPTGYRWINRYEEVGPEARVGLNGRGRCRRSWRTGSSGRLHRGRRGSSR
ncbi:MAG TPA: helix-turn-helix domain-containing protein [Terracidiphilus sp.]